jgi:hypothetical protein
VSFYRTIEEVQEAIDSKEIKFPKIHRGEKISNPQHFAKMHNDSGLVSIVQVLKKGTSFCQVRVDIGDPESPKCLVNNSYLRAFYDLRQRTSKKSAKNAGTAEDLDKLLG